MARTVNQLTGQVDVVATLDETIDLLREQDEFLVFMIRSLSEWTYGLPWPEVEAAFAQGGGDLLQPAAVADGLIQPLIPVLATASSAVLDSGDLDRIASAVQELTAMEELAEGLGTLSTLIQDQESELFATATDDLGAFLLAADVPGSAGENALLTFAAQALAPNDALEGLSPALSMLPPVGILLDDSVAIDRVVDVLGNLYDDQLLQPLPDQIHTLVNLQSDGSGWTPGQRTAFEDLFRLLEVADQPLSCALVINEESLAIYILETIAGFDASTIELAVSLSQGLVDFLLTLGDLVCTGLDPELAGLFPSIVQLAETGALRSLVPLLDALYDPIQAQHDHLREVLDLLLALQTGGTLPAATDLARRELGQPFVGNAMTTIGAFVAPTDPTAVGDIHTLLRVGSYAVGSPAGGGPADSPIGLLLGPANTVLASHETELALWIQDLGALLIADETQTHMLLDKIAPLLSLDPELDTLETAGAVVGDAEVLGAVLRILETPEVLAALAPTNPESSSNEGPIGLLGRLSSDGSLESILRLVHWLIDTLDGIGLLPAD